MALRRRSIMEQRVVRLIRGERPDAMPSVPAMQFGRLRDLAVRNALVIHPPGTPFLSVNELTLLGWLALAQRVAGYRRQFHPDAMLTMTVVHCAGTLDALGIHLPPLTFCGVGRTDAG
ncbi:MAG: hypothetical protein QM690_10555 [Sphingobium sp.]